MHLLYAADRPVDAYLVGALREAGHVVDVAAGPGDGLAMAATIDFEAIVLDWSVPPIDHAGRFAAAAPLALILAIAPKSRAGETAAILSAGADALLARPISIMELEARLQALTRLVHRHRPNVAAAGDEVRMAVADRAVHIHGQAIGLTGREFQLMRYFVDRPGEVISLDRLQEQVWGDAVELRLDRVRTCLSRLRKKLEAAGAGHALSAVAGHGYVFRPDARPR